MNPYTGQPITTRAEYEAYRERFKPTRRPSSWRRRALPRRSSRRFSRASGGAGSPAGQSRGGGRRKAGQRAGGKGKGRRSSTQTRAIDPTVKGLGNLAKLDTYPKLTTWSGISILDAYRLANYDTLTQRAAEASRKAAINSVQSKEHLKATESSGGGAIPVPDSVLEEYRVLNPGATKEENPEALSKLHEEQPKGAIKWHFSFSR